MKKISFKLGELFCGPGGLACGALRSKSNDGQYSLVHAWANDYDSDSCKTYIHNICPTEPKCKTKDSFIFFKEVGYSGIYGDITG